MPPALIMRRIQKETPNGRQLLDPAIDVRAGDAERQLYATFARIGDLDDATNGSP